MSNEVNWAIAASFAALLALPPIWFPDLGPKIVNLVRKIWATARRRNLESAPSSRVASGAHPEVDPDALAAALATALGPALAPFAAAAATAAAADMEVRYGDAVDYANVAANEVFRMREEMDKEKETTIAALKAATARLEQAEVGLRETRKRFDDAAAPLIAAP